MTRLWFADLLAALGLLASGDFWHRLGGGVHELWRLLHAALCRLIHREKRPQSPLARNDCCVDLPPDVYKRADPLIYAQYYLMSMGLAVTWDNPDIELLDGSGPAVGPLKPRHHYRVRVRVWNGSYDAPAVGVGVELSYLSFGAQTVSHPLGLQSVALGAKGTADQPAFTEFDWETPDVGGHYCLQVRLGWSDDANPNNNLGQRNIMVAEVHSAALFSFTVRNDATVTRRFTIEADDYALPPLAPCEAQPPSRAAPRTRIEESRLRWEEARRTQAYGRHGVPPGCTVDIVPSEFELQGRTERVVQVAIEPQDVAFRGGKTFNLHAFAHGDRGLKFLAGGVSLRVVKS